MSIVQAIILGVVQGLTEFLPVSSSGHLVVLQHFLGLTEPQLLFDVTVHAATFLAIIVYFNTRLPSLLWRYWRPLALGTVPAGLAGVFFKDTIEGFFSSLLLVGITLMITGGVNLLTDRLLSQEHERLATVTWRQGLVIGLAQMLAITPGISRSGSTVFAGIKNGLNRETAFEFSFLLALPAVGGATLLQVLDVIQSDASLALAPLVAGALSAFIVGLVSLWLLHLMIKTAKFEWFGYYCLTLGGVTLLSQLW